MDYTLNYIFLDMRIAFIKILMSLFKTSYLFTLVMSFSNTQLYSQEGAIYSY